MSIEDCEDFVQWIALKRLEGRKINTGYRGFIDFQREYIRYSERNRTQMIFVEDHISWSPESWSLLAGGLSSYDKFLFVYYIVYGYTYKEISFVLDVAVSTVERHIKDLVNQLRLVYR